MSALPLCCMLPGSSATFSIVFLQLGTGVWQGWEDKGSVRRERALYGY